MSQKIQSNLYVCDRCWEPKFSLSLNSYTIWSIYICYECKKKQAMEIKKGIKS